MRVRALMVVVVVLVAGSVVAQQAPVRAWQHRLAVEEPLPVPVKAVDPVDPLAVPVDVAPQLVSAVPPRKVDVLGTARLAVYVDADGRCQGAVPVNVPFPGIATEVVEDMMKGRYEPARSGKAARPAWTAIDITLAGSVKRAALADQSLELPDAAVPPTAAPEPPPYVSGRLARLPAADPGELTVVATPRRLSVRVAGLEAETPIRLLAHVTVDGRCDKVVPLEMAPGLRRWVLEFLGSWRLKPATRDGQPVAAWVMYRGRLQLKLSTLRSTTVRVLPDAAFTPVSAPAAQSPPVR